MRCIVRVAVAVLLVAVGVMGQEARPDLVILRIQKVQWGVGLLFPFKIIATVKNVGEAPSTPTHLRWGTAEEGAYAAVLAVPALAPGEEYDLVIYHGVEPFDPPWFPITVRVYLEIDPFNRVGEKSEENNTKFGVFSYKARGWPRPIPPKPWRPRPPKPGHPTPVP